MLLLLAVLLGFLAQNLLTPSRYDFAGVLVCLAALGLALYARQRERHFQWHPLHGGALALVIVAMAAAWQLLPAGMAAIALFLVAGEIFPVRATTGNLPYRSPEVARRWQLLVIGAVLLASAALSVYDNQHIQPGLHGDEAESGIEARNLNAGRYNTLIGVGWYDQPLASFLVQAVGLRVFGDSISGLRTTSAVISLLTLPLVYLLARKLFGTRAALIALVLMGFAHWFIAYARIGINYNQTTLLEVLAVLTFWHGWQTRRLRWFLLSGVVTGMGLYLYFASRLVPILLLAFALYVFWWQRRGAATPTADPHDPATFPRLRWRQVALWLVISGLVFLPMGLYFVEHAKEFNSRAAFVFLFSDTQFGTAAQKMRTYTGTEDVPSALLVQVQRYAALFNVGGARDGQYGNTRPLIEYYTAVFFVLGLAYALYHARQPRHMLLLMWIVLTVFVGGVLTIESPFTPRIVGLMPVPFMLAALAIDQVWALFERASETRTRFAPLARWTPYAVGALLLSAVIYSNYWSYFEYYIHSIDGWAQREPATVIANYAAQLPPDQTLYVLSAPELFVWHGTIRFIAPRVRGYDLLDPVDDLPVRDARTERASFVMLPNYTQWLDKLKKLYPHGEVKEWRRPWGELWFVIYEVPAADIAAQR